MTGTLNFNCNEMKNPEQAVNALQRFNQHCKFGKYMMATI